MPLRSVGNDGKSYSRATHRFDTSIEGCEAAIRPMPARTAALRRLRSALVNVTEYSTPARRNAVMASRSDKLPGQPTIGTGAPGLSRKDGALIQYHCSVHSAATVAGI